MMKKKFGLGLSHLISPPRSDEKHGGIANMAMSPDGSPPPSPYPGRRAPLPHKTEAELRSACLAMLTNQTPSHLIAPPYENAKPASVKAQLDYAAIKKSIDKPTDVDDVRPNRRSTRTIEADSSEMAELQANIESNKYSYKPDASVADLFTTTGRNVIDPMQLNAANSVRRRDDRLVGGASHARTKSAQLSQAQAQPMKVATSASLPLEQTKVPRRAASQKTNGSTPQTDATEYPWSTSTAPTTAGVTPARNSKRASIHAQLDQDTNIKTDATPMDRIRSELERRKQQVTTRSRRPSEHERPDMSSVNRAPSRARSIRSNKSVRSIRSVTASLKENIREYIRPGSSKGPSRATSRSGSRVRHMTSNSTSSDADKQERGPTTRPPPRRDWRNWGRSRKDDGNGNSSGDVSRSNSTRGRSENRAASSAKPEINLNRELPPLPSLDKWDEKIPSKPTHIVNMRSPTSRVRAATPSVDQQEQPAVYLVKTVPTSEKDEVVEARLGKPVRTKPEVYHPTRSHKQIANNSKQNAYNATGVARTTDTDRDVRDGGVRIEFSLEDLMPSYDGAAPPIHLHSKSTNSARTLETASRLRAEPPLKSQWHSRTGSAISHSMSMKTSHSQTPSDLSKSSSSLPTTAPSFSRHRKYDTSDIPPALNSNMANQGRKVANKSEGGVTNAKYRHVAELPSTGKTTQSPAPHSDEKKAWWQLKSKQKKQMTWMDQLEKLGIKDGVLLNNEVAGSPVVRY